MEPQSEILEDQQGSILDSAFTSTLGTFDIVYSWGVLHHTGQMWKALDNAASLVKPGGLLFIALYNNQGRRSVYWKGVKTVFNRSRLGKLGMVVLHLPYPLGASLIARAVRGELRSKSQRGMAYWSDYLDWLGGLPFEVASPAEVHDFLEKRGFSLSQEKLTRRLGCNEFVFRAREVKN